MPVGVGTGIGQLFRQLGANKLANARLALYGQQLREQQARQQAAADFDESRTLLNRQIMGARTNLAPDLIANGVAPERATLQGDTFGASPNDPEKAMRGIALMQIINRLGDPVANNTAAGIDNTKVAGGVAFNPTLAPAADGQSFQNVGATDANIAAAFARAHASNAAAGASGARATLLGTQNRALMHPDQVPGAAFNKPSGSGASGAPKVMNRTAQSDATIAAVNQMILQHKMTTAEAQRRFNVMGRPDLAARVYDPSLSDPATGNSNGG